MGAEKILRDALAAMDAEIAELTQKRKTVADMLGESAPPEPLPGKAVEPPLVGAGSPARRTIADHIRSLCEVGETVYTDEMDRKLVALGVTSNSGASLWRMAKQGEFEQLGGGGYRRLR